MERLTNQIQAFKDCRGFDADLGDWDANNVTNMRYTLKIVRILMLI